MGGILVTGGAGAIGGALVRALAPDVEVLVIDRRAGDPLPGVTYHVCDLADLSEIDALVSQLVGEATVLDGVVHCAGLSQAGLLADTLREEWLEVLAVDLIAPMTLTQQLAPLIRPGGSLVFVTSGVIYTGPLRLSAYVAAKAGVTGFARAMARELGGRDITVNCVAPGLTDTPGVKDLAGREAAQIASRSIKRREVPEDLVGALLFLLSPGARFVTGQTLVVDGGAIMH
jgi:3-oxoacyl-[acyl-carrier protein] reductase